MTRPIIRLVIAEDEDSIRERIADYIRRETTVIDEVYTAETGQETLDLIYRYRPQLLLLDIQMPIKDGLMVLKEAIAAGVCPKTIVLSGHDDFVYAQKSIQYGVVEYMLKPGRSTDILSKLETIAREFLPNGGEEQVSESSIDSGGNRFVEEALQYMREHYPNDITQPEVAKKLGVSASYLSTLFTKHVGYGFAESLNRIRVKRACDYFVDTSIKIYEVASHVGFNDEKYFSSVFKSIMGVTPSQYRQSILEGEPE